MRGVQKQQLKILLTGGSGFIGKNVKEYLENKGFDVYAPTSSELDCLNEVKVAECLKSQYFDVVLHFAVYGDGIDKRKDGTKVLEYNLRMFQNFYIYADLFGKMIYTGSGAEYDKRYPIVCVTEDDLKHYSIPIDQYGLMKRTVNSMIEQSRNIYNLRLFGIFGKYEYWKTKYISNLCCKSLKGLPLSLKRNCYFDYLWIDDFCRLVELFINLKEPRYHVYNAVSGMRVSLYDLAVMVNEIADEKRDIIVCSEGLANEYTASNEKIMSELQDWEITDLHISVARLFRWYQEHIDEIDSYSLIYG